MEFQKIRKRKGNTKTPIKSILKTNKNQDGMWNSKKMNETNTYFQVNQGKAISCRVYEENLCMQFSTR